MLSLKVVLNCQVFFYNYRCRHGYIWLASLRVHNITVGHQPAISLGCQSVTVT